MLFRSGSLVRTGYDFLGWNTAADGSGTDYAASGSLTTAADVILYAKWRAKTLSVSYQLNGGTGSAPSEVKLYGETVTVAAAPTRTGYSFARWYDGTAYKSPSDTVTVTANIVFVAQWTAQSYSISYNGNGSNGGTAPETGTVTTGGVPYPIAANTFTRTGYTFGGWFTTSAATGGAEYLVGAGYSESSSVVLYARWTAGTYRLTYNANGATSGTVPDSATVTTGVAFNLSTNSGALAKTGYTFSGWYTNATGTGGNAYAESAPFTTTSNVTLFAN